MNVLEFCNAGVKAVNTHFSGNSLYGASLLGAAALDSCAFAKNKHGLRLVNLSHDDLKCRQTRVVGNAGSGIQLEGCTMTLSGGGVEGLTTTRNRVGIRASESTLRFEGFTGYPNRIGAWLGSSKVTISDSTFSGCRIGVWAHKNKSFAAKASKFTNNRAWGAYLVGEGTIHDCSIANNGHGLLIAHSHPTDSRLTSTSVADNTGRGLCVLRASVELSKQGDYKWVIARNGTNLYCQESDVTLAGLELTDATLFGVYARQGILKLDQVSVSSRAYGVYGSHTSGMTVHRTQISASGSNSRGWGLMSLHGNVDLRNTIVSGMTSGILTSGTDSQIYNATIANVTAYGVYASRGKTNVWNTIISGKGGGYGLCQSRSANLSHSHNLIHGFSRAFYNTTADPTEVLRSPRFVSQTGGDLRLSKGSPAINAGKDLTSMLTMDMLGNRRPSHKVFEIGAYEYMEKSGSFRVLDWREKR